MQEDFTISNNWLATYKKMRSSTEETSFNSFFIYHLISFKCDIESFSDVIRYIYDNNDITNIDRSLCRFFDIGDLPMPLNEYVDLDKYNNHLPLWNNLCFLFIDIGVDKKFTLDQQNLPYLLSLLENITDDKVMALYYAKYHYFVFSFIGNLESIFPLIEIAQKNSAFSVSKEKEHKSFFHNLFCYIGEKSYDLSPERNKQIYHTLSKSIYNIDDIIIGCLFNTHNVNRFTNQHNDKIFPINLAILNFCLNISFDIVPHIQTRYIALYQEIKFNNPTYNDTDIYKDIILSVFSSLHVGFSDMQFSIDCSSINIKKNVYENYIYLKLIEISIINKNALTISQQVVNYFLDILGNDDEKIIKFNNRYFHVEETGNYLKHYAHYLKMESSLEQKNIIDSIKHKI